MKYTHILLFSFLLLQQHTIEPNVVEYFKSFLHSEEISQKVIHKKYQNIDHLTISHTRGDIIIQTWEQTSIAFEIAHNGSEDFLEHAEIVTQKFDATLAIQGRTETKSNNFTDLHIIVPKKTTITITLEKGDISISESDGALDVYTEQGDIQIDQGTNDLKAKSSKGNITVYRRKSKNKKTIEATAEKGDIFLCATESSNLDIDAQTNKGKISSSVPITLHPVTLKINSESIAQLEKKISGFIGESLSKTKLLCYTGNIHIEPYI